jgi:hypothetical protein
VLWRVAYREDSIAFYVSSTEENMMRLLAICWMAGWIIAGIFIAGKKGTSRGRAAIEALLFGPFVLLILSFAKQTKKK